MPTYEPDYQSDEYEPEDQPLRRRCRHIFTAGRRCGSPCLRTEQFCYHHHTTRKPVTDPKERKTRTSTFDLPNPEDRDAIRSAVTQIMHAIAHNAIDLKRAGMLLYSLQISLCALPPQARPAPLKTSAIPANQVVEDIVLDDQHGVIAPEDEYEEPEELKPRKSLARQLLDEVERYEARQAAEAAARQAEESATQTPIQTATETVAPSQSPDSETTASPHPHRPAAIDLRAAADPCANRPPSHPARKCHPEWSLARPCARRSRRTCISPVPPQPPGSHLVRTATAVGPLNLRARSLPSRLRARLQPCHPPCIQLGA